MNLAFGSKKAVQRPFPRLTNSTMKIETPYFSLKLRPGLTAEQRGEVAHAICRILIDPPRPQTELRRVAVRTAMAQYEGSKSRRAKELERHYANYLASGWRIERDLENPHRGHRGPRLHIQRTAGSGIWMVAAFGGVALTAGTVVLWNPFQSLVTLPSGLVILTYVLIAYFIVDGILMIILAIAHRRELSSKWEWTNRTCGSPASGSRTRSHAFTHDGPRPSWVKRTSRKCPYRCESG
jgi:hypothetical protein